MIINIAAVIYIFLKARDLYKWAGLMFWYTKRCRMSANDECNGIYTPVVRREISYRFRCKDRTLFSHETIDGPPKKWNCTTEEFEDIKHS